MLHHTITMASIRIMLPIQLVIAISLSETSKKKEKIIMIRVLILLLSTVPVGWLMQIFPGLKPIVESLFEMLFSLAK